MIACLQNTFSIGALHPAVWAGAAFLLAFLLMLVVCIWRNRRYRQRKDREMASMVSQFIDERN
jgi:TRAP-type C4-dicarboxylate transport system permease large subunit